MNLIQAFRSPVVRVSFLVFAVAATVATSQPAWGLDDTASDEKITLSAEAQKTVLDRKVQYDASHAVTIVSKIDGDAPTGTKIRVTISHDGADPSAADGGAGGAYDVNCHYDVTFVRSDKNWDFIAKDGTTKQGYTNRIEARSSCNDKTGTATLTIENLGETTPALHWVIAGEIGESGKGSPPDGAFVTAKLVTE